MLRVGTIGGVGSGGSGRQGRSVGSVGRPYILDGGASLVAEVCKHEAVDLLAVPARELLPDRDVQRRAPRRLARVGAVLRHLGAKPKQTDKAANKRKAKTRSNRSGVESCWGAQSNKATKREAQTRSKLNRRSRRLREAPGQARSYRPSRSSRPPPSRPG